jgi:uncharacterized protein (TIGR04255 family)
MPNKNYKNNFIKKVIAKIEFAEPIDFFTPETISEVVKEIKDIFNVSEQSTALTGEIQISREEIKTFKEKINEWVFRDSDRTRILKFNKLFIEILLTKYNSENDYKNYIISPIEQLLENHSNVTIQRTGVRFINIFDFEIKSFTDPTTYFTESITKHLSIMANSGKCCRSMMINEYIFDDIQVRVNSGLFNPDYPAIIKRNQFVIDIDAFINVPHLINDCEQHFKNLHNQIEQQFELLINDKLRDEVLNG